MKKIILILGAVILLAGLCGCAGDPLDEVYVVKLYAEQVEYTGEYWDEITIPANELTTIVGSGPNESNFQSGFCYIFADEIMAMDEVYVHFNVELPHNYKEGTDIIVNVHWAFNADEVGTFVRWKLGYSWANEGVVFPVTSHEWVLSNASNNDHTVHQVTKFDSLDGTGKEIYSLLLCYISRNSSNAADTYTDTADLLGVSVLYQVDAPGSISQWDK